VEVQQGEEVAFSTAVAALPRYESTHTDYQFLFWEFFQVGPRDAMLRGYLSALVHLALAKRTGMVSVETVGAPFRMARERWVAEETKRGRYITAVPATDEVSGLQV
jgi:hypothetical protein